MNNPKESKCTGKQRFDSAELAQTIARMSRRRSNCRVMVYRCEACKGWHIGNHGKKKRMKGVVK